MDKFLDYFGNFKYAKFFVIVGVVILLYVVTVLGFVDFSKNKSSSTEVIYTKVDEEESSKELDKPNYVGSDVVNKEEYLIRQYSNDHYIITINKFPFEEYVYAAEQELMERTQLSRSQLCKKDIVITTPYDVNPHMAGKNIRLSFCN